MSPLRTTRKALTALLAGAALISTVTLVSSAPASAVSYRTTKVTISKIKVVADGDGGGGCGEIQIRPKLWNGWESWNVATFGDYDSAQNQYGYGGRDDNGTLLDLADLCTGQTRNFPNGLAHVNLVATVGTQHTYVLSASESDPFEQYNHSDKVQTVIPKDTPLGDSFKTIKVNSNAGPYFELLITVKITVKDGK